ncbi:Innexin [Fasciolopsis buskii]|uniref:Innexin n=1 Tax=Fasciolopsis buskii TaxID=27845 RepID=A0A8E0VEX8_9TREM|nr:Innexin [Fasciolopsis buski]
MVAAEFFDYVFKFHVPDYVGVEDFADKMSFLYSVLILFICTLVVTVKQYLFSPIACYIPTVPSGTDFDKFLESFCWVQGTIPILAGDKIPQTLDEWAYFDRKYRINYYQWIPFMLGLQGLMFYIPRIVWQLICSHRTGTDLEHLVTVATQAGQAGPEDRQKLVTHVASSLETMLYQHAEYRTGRITNFKKRMYKACGLLVVSKRLGTWLAFSYFFIKLCYLTNSIGQLYLMQRFLGFNETMGNFGAQLANYMLEGRNWEQTRIFPRISFCYLADIRQLGSVNRYVAQCVLPVNMLNEKLYIFLWYWTGLVAICTAISIPLWMIRLGILRNRMHFIKKFLRINEQFQRADKLLLKSFTQEFLRHDGVFLLRMISMNSGDVITSEVIKELWRMYCTKQSSSIKSDHDSSPPEPPSLRDRRATAPEPPQLDKTNYGTNSSMKKRSFV